MNKELAERLMQEFTKAAKALDASELVAREITDETSQMDLRRAIATVGASLYSDVMTRVFVEFPDLEPKFDTQSK